MRCSWMQYKTFADLTVEEFSREILYKLAGRLFRSKVAYARDEVYMLVTTGLDRHQLVSLGSGNRYSDSSVTHQELLTHWEEVTDQYVAVSTGEA